MWNVLWNEEIEKFIDETIKDGAEIHITISRKERKNKNNV